jgi:hypothetical protein
LIPCAKALALATSDSIPESGHLQQPARDPPAELVVQTVRPAEPARRTKKNARPYFIQSTKNLW